MKEPIAQRHGRAVALIGLAAVVMAIAGAVYLRSTLPPQQVTAASTSRMGESPISFPQALPTPQSPRSTGLLAANAESVLIQQYGGLNVQNPLGLIASVETSDPAVIRRVVQELNALPVFPSGVRSCPMDDGSYFAIVLTYAGGAPTPIKVEASGCRAVSIGGSKPIVLWAFNSPGLYDALRAMLAR